MEPPFLADYEKTTGEKPAVTIFADEDEAFSKMRAGFKPDVMGPCYYEFPRWKEAGLLAPIDTSKLKNWNKISPTLRNLPGISAGPGKVWFVPHYWGNTSLTIRTDLAPEYAKSQSWDILFDPKYKGRVSVTGGGGRHRALHRPAWPGSTPMTCRMPTGGGSRPSCGSWCRICALSPPTTPHWRRGWRSGEIVAAMSWRTTFAALNREHKPVAYLNPPGGIFTYVCGLVMHKDPSNEAKALALIDSVAVGRGGRLHHRAYRR